MGIPYDDVILIQEPSSPGEPTVITVNCPDKTGLGCDLCRVIVLFGLNIVKGDMSTDGRWCYIVFWVIGRGEGNPRWNLLKKRLLEMCPVFLPEEIIGDSIQMPQIYLLKFTCYDRMGLLHDVTQVLCELELTIRRVKVSTTPDGQVLDLFFITDTKDQLHLKSRREETSEKLKSILGDSMTSCEIGLANKEMSPILSPTTSPLPSPIKQEMFNDLLGDEDCAPFLRNGNVARDCNWEGKGGLRVEADNDLSPVHTLIKIECVDHKGLLYDILRTLKDCKIQLSYGRFYTSQNGSCEIDLFVVRTDGQKITDSKKREELCFRLKTELFRPLKVALTDRGPDMELLVANPVEVSGKGRPLVFYDITLALKIQQIRIFLAEIARHRDGEREWEVYRVHLGESHEISAPRNKIIEAVTKRLMGWI